MKTSLLREWATDILYYLAGGLLFGTAMQVFIVPNHIAPGGVSAIAVVLNFVLGGPVGLWTLLLNVPIMILAWKYLGRTFFCKTLAALFLYSTLTDALYYVLPPYPSDPLLSALAGGVLMGVGFALVFMRGSTSGGVDVISRLIQLRQPHISMGRLLLVLDVIIISLSAFVFRDLSTVLYSVVTVFASTKTIDSILYGLDRGKLVYIMTQKSQSISQRVIAELGRGCTILPATGAYTQQPVSALLVALRVQQLHHLRKIAADEDPDSFIIVTDAAKIYGLGFLQ